MGPSILIAVLISQLSSQSYRERVIANKKLQELVPYSIPYLEQARTCKNMNVSLQSSKILQKYYWVRSEYLSERIRPNNWYCLPWIDMLPSNYPDRDILVSRYLEIARTSVKTGGSPDWEDYRFASKLFIRDFLRQNGCSVQKTQLLLKQMVNMEVQWYKKSSGRNLPMVPGTLWRK